ncbi:NnrS family protein [Sulfurospirillum diekertiae]|uniref:NnrS family protein n=1 Tax=Sulfurospirillum diekertiae TaxID=1854492 RepID=UPI001CF7BECE|nr:NnrS family protein [Sulfurospirillum diekertiae]
MPLSMQPTGGLVVVVFVSSLTPPEPVKTTALQNLAAQPHRIFFFAGVVQSVLFVALIGLQYAGLVSLHVSVGLYHAYAMTFIVFTQFFAGFLLTTFPRYLSRPSASPKAYLPIVWLINGGGLLFMALSFVSAMALVVSMLMILAGYVKLCLLLLDFQTKSTVTNKSDTTWMLRAFALGLVGQLLFIADPFLSTYALALGVSFYLYLFFIVLIVSQKMMPFFAANTILGYSMNKSKHFLLFVFVALILKVILEALSINAFVADSALFGIITYELLKWRLPFRKSPAILWVLFLSIWWVPVGFGLFVVQDFSALVGHAIYLEKSPLHALALGYFTTVLVGFGTRVILGHSGRTPKADMYAVTLFGLIQAMALIRIIAGIFPQFGYLHAVLTVAVLWIVIFGLWSKRYIGILFEK